MNFSRRRRSASTTESEGTESWSTRRWNREAVASLIKIRRDPLSLSVREWLSTSGGLTTISRLLRRDQFNDYFTVTPPRHTLRFVRIFFYFIRIVPLPTFRPVDSHLLINPLWIKIISPFSKIVLHDNFRS